MRTMIERREISVSTDTFIRAALVIAGIVLIVLIRDILLALLVSVVIATVINPSVDFFVKFRLPRVLAAALVFAFLFLALIGFFYFFVPIIVKEVSHFLVNVPEYSRDIDTLDEEVRGALFSLEEIAENIRASISALSESVFAAIGVIFGGLFSFILIMAIAFYIAIQERGIARFISYVAPAQHATYALNLWERSQKKISRWFWAVVLSSSVVGIVVYIGLLALGVPHAFFFALLAAILNFIPIVGPIIAAVPAVIAGFIDGGPLIGALTIALFVLIQSLENNVVYPLITGKVVGISPIIIILAIAVGLTLGGFIGALIAVPVSAVILEILKDIRDGRINKQEPPPENERLAEG
jgi:predicted PurR-regulated permease PerM